MASNSPKLKYSKISGVKVGTIAPQVFGRLTTRGDVFMLRDKPFVVSECRCGKTAVVSLWHLRSGHTSSCGCHHDEVRRAVKTTHGRYGSTEHNTWSGMKQRCNDPGSPNYSRYGGRGITVCSEWNESFEAFFNDMGPRPSSRHSLDRVNNNLGYSKSNCRWATRAEQCSNRSTSVIVEFYGKRRSLTEWSAISQVPVNAIYSRIKRHWPVKLAVWAPLGVRLSELRWAQPVEVSANG